MQYRDLIQQGNLFKEQNRLEDATVCYRRAIELKATSVWALQGLGILLAAQQQVDAAIEVFQRAIALRPDSPNNYRAYCQLGDLLGQQIGQQIGQTNRVDEAIAVYEQAVALKSDHPDAYSSLANLLARQGRLDQAIGWQEQAIQFTPDNSSKNLALKHQLLVWKTQLQDQANLAECHYKIVSLGVDCLSRTVPTRWGLKPRKAEGELSCPFDLSVHPYRSVCQLLNRNFQDYLNPQYLETRGKGAKTITINKKYRTRFNHETGLVWVENNFQNLIQRYESRIRNFYDYLTHYPILFVLHDRQGEGAESLVDIIVKKFPKLRFKLLVINTSGKQYAAISQELPIEVCQVALPGEACKWYLPKFYASPAGIEFEQRIYQAAKQIIVQSFRRSDVECLDGRGC